MGQELVKDILGTPGVLESSNEVPALSRDDVRRLNADRFEALVALLEERRGAQVLLTPYSNDEGIDVVAMQGREIRLIQCKHTLWNASVDANVVAELIVAFDGYRARRLKSLLKTSVLCPVLVTNGKFTAKAQAEAKSRDIRLVADADLWRLLDTTPCTAAGVEAVESRRLASMPDVQWAIERKAALGNSSS